MQRNSCYQRPAWGFVRAASAVFAFVMLLAPLGAPFAQPSEGSPEYALSCESVVLFHRQGCPHCERANAFLDQLEIDIPEISIERYDIQRDAEARARFFELSAEHQVTPPGVPAFLVCDQFSVGFADSDTSGEVIKAQLTGDPASIDRQISGLTGRRVSAVTADRVGLPLFTIIIGLIDGFNPCAMWVLTFLLSLLVGTRSRQKIILIAGTFVFMSGLMYFAFMAAWLNAFLLIGFSRPLQLILGGIAGLIAIVHIKDFFAFRQGVTFSIPESAKPTIFARARRVISEEQLLASILGVALLAALVNLVEFLCTAGLPAVYTQILSMRGLDTTQYYGYLVLYNLAYIFDDALMVGIAVYTLIRWRMQERQGRWLKLVSGIAILGLALLLVFAPDLLF